MRTRSPKTLVVLFASVVAMSGCATTETETVPLESIADYDEKPDYVEETTGTPEAERNDEDVSADCQDLRESIENWEKAYAASIGLGALGFATGVAGLLTGSEEAQKIGGALGSLGILSQATTSTGADIQKKKALERECFVE